MKIFSDTSGWHCMDRCDHCGQTFRFDAVVRKTGKVLPATEDPESTRKRWEWRLTLGQTECGH